MRRALALLAVVAGSSSAALTRRLPTQVDRRAALEMRPDDTAFIWGDRSALMRESTGAPRETKGPGSENIQDELLQWGPAFTSLIDLLEPALTSLFGGRCRCVPCVTRGAAWSSDRV